ncbi:DUF1127 domain-containing protein [Neptuniibacter halophilus]|uniref:DUF1127 domain-containing protein n=1 Tax=Neptuniibacter halophilus TaxID=651666 RepID=UPI00257367B2|nr:DUF1127 domain-containing protein [Neptuniibacter halophilus]
MINTACSAGLCQQKSKSFYLSKTVQILGGIQQKIQQWKHNHHSRKALARLDRRALSDIGLSRSDALTEARKPFWKP